MMCVHYTDCKARKVQMTLDERTYKPVEPTNVRSEHSAIDRA